MLRPTHHRFWNRLAVATALALATAWWIPSATALEITDQGISDAIEDEYMIDPSVPYNNLDVSTAEGIVTLTGSVNNLLAKERAVAIAETIKGVRSVVDEISVAPIWSISDETLRKDVEDAFLYDPATESWEIGTSVVDGVVTLTGQVDSWQEKQLAETVASSVRGVREVHNLVSVDSDRSRSDREIETEVEAALRWDVLVDHQLIEVEVEKGSVRLSGIVGSASEKGRAMIDAWVAGVEDVDASALEVAEWADDEYRREYAFTAATDDEIEQAVNDALLFDPRVSTYKIAPHVELGEVTLRGSVSNLEAKRAAQEDARHTTGVVAVVNRIKIVPEPLPSDSSMTEQVRSALSRDPFVERHEVGVSVLDGVVTLTGSVDSYFEKSRADRVAATADGVIDVRNKLRVDDTRDFLAVSPYIDPYPLYDEDWYDYETYHALKSDAKIASDVHSQLWWSPFVDANEVNIAVDDGVVELSGEVDSWTEREAATKNAFDGGAVWVDNDLKVK